jgi:DNA-binding XRE family transcriptional regulator
MTDEKDPEDVRVGATIKALRDAHGLKAVELAVALGISSAYMSNIEAGRKHAPIAICQQIAKLFRVKLAAITIEDYEKIREPAA